MARAPKEYNRDAMPNVIAGLSAEKPITKKAACEMLGITYNTTRLESLIQEYKDDLERIKLRKQQTRKQAVTEETVREWAKEYLVNGMPINEIAEYAYRTPLLVKTWLERYGALLPKQSPNPLDPEYVPEACMSSDFEEGELVYVNGYCSFGIIKKEIKSKTAEAAGYKAYRILLLGDQRQFVNYMSCDICAVEHLGFTVDSIPRLSTEEQIALLNAAVSNANKRDK
jgi:hypothetical protein